MALVSVIMIRIPDGETSVPSYYSGIDKRVGFEPLVASNGDR